VFELLLEHSPMAFRTGELSLARGWPLLWMWAAMAVALVLVCWTLWRQRHLGLWRCGVLAALQLSFIAVVLLALWRPVLRVQHIRDQGNVVALLVDASPSMTGGAKPRRDAALMRCRSQYCRPCSAAPACGATSSPIMRAPSMRLPLRRLCR
jgi:hypothetical protein